MNQRAHRISAWSAAALIVFGTAARSHAGAVETVDLASNSAWTVSIDGGGYNTVTVPGNIRMSSTAIYRRNITIPSSASGRVVKVLFGAVNYGCEVYLGSTLITSHMNIDKPFEADLTGHVSAGQSYTLEVRAHHRDYYDNRIPQGCDWTRLAYGIARYVKLVVLPQVNIKDVFVKSSVADNHLVCDVWVHNASSQQRSVSIGGSFTSWNNDSWSYPQVPQTNATVPAGSVTKVEVGPIPWDLGPESYWWPNIPFDENYQAKLHYINLDLRENTTNLDTAVQRFGFTQYGEGPYYYTINGVRFNGPSDGTAEAQFGYNAYSETSTFTTQCVESFKRYMRLGCNTNRTHSSIPTEHMMNVADEIGFMIIPESAIRGFEQSGVWDSAAYTDDVRDMARACRDHPSTIRYSIANEFNTFGAGSQVQLLVDAIWQVDSTRPLVEEGMFGGARDIPGAVTTGRTKEMMHYKDYRYIASRKSFLGMGEYAWDTWQPNYCGEGDLMRQGDLGLDMRKRDYVYFAIWTITNYWPNFLPDMSLACCSQHGNRTDGVDGWGSHEVEFVQRCLHPYVVCDSMMDEENLCYSSDWPSTVPSTSSGATLDRKIYVFNHGLRGNRFKLIWEARWDSPTGTLAATDAVDNIAIEPGFHEIVPVSLTVPTTSATANQLGTGAETEVYEETRYYFNASGRRLYFVLRSVLYPPLSRFGVTPDPLLLSGTGSLTGDVTVSHSEGSLPTLSAQGNQTWLSATVDGQTIHTTADASGLASGIHSGSVILSAAGYEPVTCGVEVHVDGAPGAAELAITPYCGVTLPSGTESFSVEALDQFGDSYDANVNWSVSGGGSIDASGVFTSNGTEGTFTVTATDAANAEMSATARVVVTAGTALTSGSIDRMLVLCDRYGFHRLPTSAAIHRVDPEFLGSGATVPCHGMEVVTDNDGTYTWKSQMFAHGEWLNRMMTNYTGYVSVTLLSPQQRSAKLVITHGPGVTAFGNGEQIVHYADSGDGDAATMTLMQGATQLLIRSRYVTGMAKVTARVTDMSDNAFSDVTCFIDTCQADVPVVAPSTNTRTVAQGLCLTRTAGGRILLNAHTVGVHTIEILTARGRVVRTLRGEGAKVHSVPVSEMGKGIYIVRMESGTIAAVSRVVVR